MRPVDELKAVRIRVTECLELASTHFCRVFPEIPVRFDLTGRTGGMYRYRIDKHTGKLKDQEFRFNRVLAKENLQEYLDQICAHEVAHYITRNVWGPSPSPHGPEWQGVMRDVFKLDPSRCHRMDTSRAVKNSFIYKCACKGENHLLSTKKHNQVQRRSAIFKCKRCGEILEFIQQVEKAQPPVISKLFISTTGPAIDSAQADRIAKLIIDHQVIHVVVDCTITGERNRQLLSKKLGVPLSSVTRHLNAETLPGGVTHAIVFGDGQDERQGRVAKAFEQHGVKVRMVRAGVG